jgi:diguanylate cyclase (GGDEF)-like protein
MSALGVHLNRLSHWLLGTRIKVPVPIAAQLTNGLFASVPIFLGGVINTTAVAAVAAWRHTFPPFTTWLFLELLLGALRLIVLVHGKRAITAGRTPPRLLAALLSCGWSSSVGFGTFICVTSGDWVLAAIACLSAAAMVCGICLRNFGTPRLAATMIFSALAPCAVAGLLTAEPVMTIISVQLPVFMVTIFAASFALHRMLVSWMTALGELEHSRSLNETILQSTPDHMLILDQSHDIVFSKRPGEPVSEQDSMIGRNWLSLLDPQDRDEAAVALATAVSGSMASLVTSQSGAEGEKRWFDNVVNRTSDNSGRLIVVSRDITHQKRSEESAVWMARHDTLTGLPNRALLQDRLDALLTDAAEAGAAMLILDLDNFKAINDELGHDAGDSLLRTIGKRLGAALAEGDFVARTGGDEFALLVAARSEADVQAIAARIFDSLREPISHGGRQLECGASIGASFIPRDGTVRSAIMKAADLALYAAKAAGRAQLRIFEPGMMVEVEKHQTMLAAARYALQYDTIVPHYQPKVSLRTSRIIGFEALLRWRDANGDLRGPESLHAAFDDPALSAPLSERMLEKILDDIEAWTAAGLSFGHVAINVTSADFRRGDFDRRILDRLEAKAISPACLQVEVTENVFLGRGTDNVEHALERLSGHGIRIALDDFGTGYASLSHLNQFPVDLLKIDRSFIQRIGGSVDAEAIASTVINLGHCLGLEVIAEGVETAAQEAYLMKMGCDTGQGFLYSPALPAEDVSAALVQQDVVARKLGRA